MYYSTVSPVMKKIEAGMRKFNEVFFIILIYLMPINLMLEKEPVLLINYGYVLVVVTSLVITVNALNVVFEVLHDYYDKIRMYCRKRK